MTANLNILQGDALLNLRTLPDQSVQCCVTSPPYWGLRDYGCAGQFGLEKTPEEYVAKMVAVFREVRRVLKDDGTCWINLGDGYCASPRGNADGDLSTSSLTNPTRQDSLARGDYEVKGSSDGAVGRAARADRRTRDKDFGCKPKDLVGIPWMVAFALRADGWYLRSDIIWAKPNPMPESVTDRPTKAHEYLFLLTKSQRYYYDAEAIAEAADLSNFRSAPCARREPPPGSGADTGFLNGRFYETRNKRSVWTVPTNPFPEAHFATYPPALIKPCILAGSKPGDTILDPFGGSGTTGMVALELGRKAVLIELNPEYCKLIERRCDVTPGLPL